MIAPAACWSDVTEMPHSRWGMSYTWYTAPLAKISQAPGTVGTIDRAKMYTIWAGMEMRSSENGPQIGIQNSSAVTTRMACTLKWNRPLTEAVSTTHGAWLPSVTAPK